MTLVKICGITNLEDALISAELGANALGFNFFEKSPRYIEPKIAKDIRGRLPERIKTVGVFVNETVENIVKISNQVTLDAIQLHGDETIEFVNSLRQLTASEIIKAFRISLNFDLLDVAKCESQLDAILLDGPAGVERGGSGRTFDWNIGYEIRTWASVSIYLAGGLSSENVVDAINCVAPDWVDACSRIESQPGKKDPKKVEAFIKAAKEAL